MPSLTVGRGKAPNSQKEFLLNVNVFALSGEEAGMVRSSGAAALWGLMDSAEGSGGRPQAIYGVRELQYKGRMAADRDGFLEFGRRDDGVLVGLFWVDRMVVDGGVAYRLGCSFFTTSEEARKGAAMRYEPDVEGICRPFFSSLEFRG
jgi:hypothetical protein